MKPKFLPDSKLVIYPEDEKPRLRMLEDLFSKWNQHLAENASGFERHNIVFDGFYPYYFAKKQPKILFIGRDAYNMAGKNYIEEHYCHFREGKHGTGPLDDQVYHSRILCVAYGIIKGFSNLCFPDWHNIPKASEIGRREFASKDGISFAYMNLSKFDNANRTTNADWPLIDAFIEHSTNGDRNFLEAEINILEPDVIITMNLENRIASLGKRKLIRSDPNATCYWLNTDAHGCLLIDSWHFSASCKGDITEIYEPIYEAISRNYRCVKCGIEVSSRSHALVLNCSKGGEHEWRY